MNIIKIISEIDTVSQPSLITFWFLYHFIYSMLLYLFMFILYNNTIKSSHNLIFCDIILINFITLLPGLLYVHTKSESFFSKYIFIILTYIPLVSLLFYYFYEYTNQSQSISQNAIFILCMCNWAFVHTLYEVSSTYKDFWWKKDYIPPDDHILTNSNLNSVGDTIGGLLGCILCIFLIKKSGVKLAFGIFIILYLVLKIIHYFLLKKEVTIDNIKPLLPL